MSTTVASPLVILAIVGSIAHAEPAPTYAVDLRSADALADKITSALETGLRDVGAAKSAQYRAKGTHKDRVAASTDACPSAATPACAAEIGARLGVDYVFSGMVQTRGRRFVLTLDVVNVATKKRVRSLRDVVASEIRGKAWATQIFERVVDTATGSLVITCNVSRAAVLLDGQAVTETYVRRATIDGLALGRHAIELRAPGYAPFSDEVLIDGETQLNVLLDVAAP